MSEEYRIATHIKTLRGFETCGEFFLGSNRNEAHQLFKRLKGRPVQVHEGILVMELRAVVRGLPMDVKMVSCTLEELGENCKIITKHLFNCIDILQS